MGEQVGRKPGLGRRYRPARLLLGPILLAALALASAAPAARGPNASLSWQQPTPPEGRAYVVGAGSRLTVALAAAGPIGTVVRIGARGLPDGASLSPVNGNPASATLTWAPSALQAGDYVVTVTARSASSSGFGVPRRLFVHVSPSPSPAPLEPFALSERGGASQWATLLRPVVARVGPTTSAPAVTQLSGRTPEHVGHIVFLLTGRIDQQGRYWVRVRLPILPNGSTGWIPREAVGGFQRVQTHLVINRGRFTATLYRLGRVIVRTRVGVGQRRWPTPAGEFYIRERLTGFTDPIYGPVAFGTNARSPVLTDWPGGGFIGIHGTNQPEILPGRVSHGCIRMRNAAILNIARFMPVGTPVTIH